jgi:AcrR family transcriptional regulator
MPAQPESLSSTRERNRDLRSFVRTKERLLPYVPAVDRRHQLIDAAMRVISREGAAKATTRRIVAEAGASLATLHYSFEDKQELFEAVVQHCQDLTVERFRQHQTGTPSLATAVRTLLGEFAEWARDGAEFHLAQYELFFWGLRTPPSEDLAPQMTRGYAEVLAEILADVVANDDALAAYVDDRALRELARDLLAVADGLVLQILALGPNGPSDDDIDRCAAMLLARFDRLEPGYPRA